MVQLGSDGHIWPIASLGLSYPLLLSGGLLGRRGCLASSSVVPVNGLVRKLNCTSQSDQHACLWFQVLGCSKVCEVPVVHSGSVRATYTI